MSYSILILEEELECPLSLEVINDPVLCQDGQIYEKNEIKKWFSKSNTSPMTGEELKSKKLTDFPILKNVSRVISDDI